MRAHPPIDLGGRRLGRQAVVLGLLAGGSLLGMISPTPGTAQSRPSSSSVLWVERKAEDTPRLRVAVQYGAGTLSLKPAPSGILYRARIGYDPERQTPTHAYEAGELQLGLAGSARWFPFRREGSTPGSLDLELARTVPLDLQLEFGAARADLELGGLQIRNLMLATGASETRIRVSRNNPILLEKARFEIGVASFEARDLGRLNAREIEIEAGVGDVRIDFRGLSRRDTRVRAKMGVGSLDIGVPEGVGVRIQRSSFLSPLDAPGLERTGSTYTSPNWEEATVRLELDIESAIGPVTIRTLDRSESFSSPNRIEEEGRLARQPSPSRFRSLR